MKKLICIFISSLILLSLASCSGFAEFGFEYSADKTALAPGEVLKVTATVENISVFTYTYIGSSGDYFPEAWLYPVLADGTLGEALNPDGGVVLPTDVVTHRIKKGDRGSYTYEFTIPEGFYGEYVLKLAFAGQSKIFNDVVTVTGSSDNVDGTYYGYSSVKLEYNNISIFPIKCYSYTSIHKDGEGLEGDGMGAWGLFDDPNITHNDLPCITADGVIEATLPEKTTIGNIGVYDLNFESKDIRFNTFEELSSLPAGEYVIVFDEEYDLSTGQDTHITGYDDVFKLIVPEK